MKQTDTGNTSSPFVGFVGFVCLLVCCVSVSPWLIVLRLERKEGAWRQHVGVEGETFLLTRYCFSLISLGIYALRLCLVCVVDVRVCLRSSVGILMKRWIWPQICARRFFYKLSHFFIFLSFFCRFLVVFYFFALFISCCFLIRIRQAVKKWPPLWEMPKKWLPLENAKKCKQMTRVLVKLRFGVSGRPHFSDLSRPPWTISPRVRPPHPVFESALHPEPGQLLVQTGPKNEFPRASSPGQAPLPYSSSLPAGFPRVSTLIPCIWCHEVTKGLEHEVTKDFFTIFPFPKWQ